MKRERCAAYLLAISAVTLANSVIFSAERPTPLFSCSDDKWSVELIGTSDGRLVLSTNKAGVANTVGNVEMSWQEVRNGYVVGQGGGHQSHLRLFDGVRQIILFEGEDGSLADRPGRTYAGVQTIAETNPSQDFEIECAATRVNVELLSNVLRWAQQVGGPLPVPEEAGGPYDVWF